MGNEILASLQEAISEFREDPNKKMREWWGNMRYRWEGFEAKHRWIACFLVYGILFCSIISVCYFIFDIATLFYPPINETTPVRVNAAGGNVAENVRSMLCTVIESEAAIVAIIISLTVIAVQFTASAYSPRVTDIMLSVKKNPDLFLLLFMYGLAIFSGLVLLKMEPFESKYIPSEDVSVVLWLGVFLYLALVPYILRVTKLMKPKNIISVLLEDVTNDKISDYFKTVYFCWDNVPGDDDEKLKEFLRNNDFDIDWVEKAEIRESDDVKSISIIKGENSAEIIIDEKKEKATLKITDVQTHELKVKNENGKLNIYKELEDAVKEVASSLSTVGEAAAVKERYFFSWNSVSGVDAEKLKEFLENDFDIDWVEKAEIRKSDDVKSISIIKGKNSAEIIIDEKKEKATLKITDVQTHELKVKNENGKLNIYKELEDAVKEVASSLSTVGEAAAVKERYFFSWNSVSGVDAEKLKEFLENDFDIDWVEKAEIRKSDDVKSISIIKGRNSAEIIIDEKKEKATLKITDVQTHELKVKNENGKLNIYKELEDAVKEVASSLSTVGEAAAVKERYFFSWNSVSGVDAEKLKEFLENDFDIDWVEKAEIRKSDDGKTISIIKDENSAEIIIDEKKEKATLKITDGRTHKLKVKNENGEQKIYKKNLKPAEDPVQPIVDIIYGSLRIYDLETIRYGLKKIVGLIPEFIINPKGPKKSININLGDLEKLSIYFCAHLDRIGKLAASIADEDSTKEVIKSLEKIGKDTAKEGLVDATKKVVLALKDLGEAATEKGLKDAIKESAKSLGAVGEAAAAEEEGLEDTKKEDMIIASAKSLGVLGKAAAKKELEAATTQAAESLGAVGKTAAGKGLKKLEEAVKHVASSLGDVGEAAAGNELKDATEKVTSSLKEVGEAAVKKGKELEKAALQSVLSLEVVGKAAAGNGLKDATETAVSALVIVGKVAADEGLKEHVAVVKQVVSSLGIVGEAAAAVKELEDVVKQVVSSLGIVREAAAAVKELEDVVKQVASSLGAVGKAAAGNGLKDATEAATSSLEEVGEAAVEIGKELKRAASQAVLSLGDVGEAAAGNGLKAATAIAVAALGCVGEAAAGKGIELKTVTKRAVSSLEIIARSTAAKEGLKDVAKTAVSTLGTVGKAATGEGKGLEDVTKRVVLSIEAIGATAAKEGLEDVAETAVNALRIVGEAAAGKGIELKTVTKRAVLSIEAIGTTAAKEGLKNVTEAAVNALSAVGITAEITELEDVARQAASSALAISSKEIVEAIIQDYESGVKNGSNYYKGLQKFKGHIQ